VYQFFNETGVPTECRTLSSGFRVIEQTAPQSSEPVVVSIENRVGVENGSFLYETKFSDGRERTLPAKWFIDKNGVCNRTWLEFVSKEELIVGLESFTVPELTAMAGALTLKVRIFFLLPFENLTLLAYWKAI